MAAIKHTHHTINDERDGDTARFLDAGAFPVIFAAADEAVVWRDLAARVRYHSPHDLLQYVDADRVLVEGFKSFDGWLRIDARGLTFEEALDRIA